MKKIKVFCIISCLLYSCTVNANTTSNLTARSSITDSCRVQANNISFGNLDINPNNIDSGVRKFSNFSTGNLSVLCTKGTLYTIKMTYNQHSPWAAYKNGYDTFGGIYGTKPTNSISYVIKSIPVTTILADDNTWGNSWTVGRGTGSIQDLAVYAGVSLREMPAPDTYSGSVTVNLSF